MLVAFNSSVYEPHFYSNKEIADLPVKIYGKVVELRGKFLIQRYYYEKVHLAYTQYFSGRLICSFSLQSL